VERELFVIATSERGQIAVSADAIAQLVGAAAAESYGVVALAGRGRISRLLPWGIKNASTSTCDQTASSSSCVS
jgi:uncharacterized alkaline shock family protein YloU